MTEDAIRELTRDIASVLARQDDIIRRLNALEETATGAKRTLYRFAWIIFVIIFGQLITKISGVAVIGELAKGLIK